MFMELFQVTAKGDSAKKQLDEFTDQLKSDYKQWSAKKIIEIAQSFDQHASQEIKYHQNVSLHCVVGITFTFTRNI